MKFKYEIRVTLIITMVVMGVSFNFWISSFATTLKVIGRFLSASMKFTKAIKKKL